MALRRLVRTPTMEPDMHMLAPGDFHADTTELVQMLRDGHHNVKLSAEAWERLITWIDIQAPAHGTWRQIAGDKRVMKQAQRRRTLLKLYTGRDDDPEPAADKIDDNCRVSSPVGKFAPNPWGLHDMHGNVAEWTLGSVKSGSIQRRIARGGSWYDRPKRATTTFRAAYKPWLGVYNVGFRIVIDD